MWLTHNQALRKRQTDIFQKILGRIYLHFIEESLFPDIHVIGIFSDDILPVVSQDGKLVARGAFI